jgi:hypothetical protein
MTTEIHFDKVTDIQFDPNSINKNDHPDYVDAEIISAEYYGEPMSETEINQLNENHEFVHEKLMEFLY